MKTGFTQKFTLLFPLLAITGSILAWQNPRLLTEWKPAIIPLLSLVMFGMGMTLTWQSFLAVIRRPGIISIAVLTQFLVMPSAAVLISHVLGLPQEITVGMVLVGDACSGWARGRLGSLKDWTVGGCLASGAALAGIVVGAGFAPDWPLRINVFLLGLANGTFAVAAIGSMMNLAGVPFR